MGIFDRFRSKPHDDDGHDADRGHFRLADESDRQASLTLDPTYGGGYSWY